MRAYRHGSHTEVGQHLREVIREVCKARDIEILQGHIRPDHVHLLLSVPPTLSPSRVMNAIEDRSSNRLMRNFRTLNKTSWGRHLWAEGYFVATSGNVTEICGDGAAGSLRLAEAPPIELRSSGVIASPSGLRRDR